MAKKMAAPPVYPDEAAFFAQKAILQRGQFLECLVHFLGIEVGIA
jgi:hypothetical protein